MFQVIGDILYYHGQPLAVITMPLCGAKLDAIDDLNGRLTYTDDEVSDIVKEITSDVNHVVKETLTDAIDGFWITDQQSDLIIDDLEARLAQKLVMTLAAWKAV